MSSLTLTKEQKEWYKNVFKWARASSTIGGDWNLGGIIVSSPTVRTRLLEHFYDVELWKSHLSSKDAEWCYELLEQTSARGIVTYTHTQWSDICSYGSSGTNGECGSFYNATMLESVGYEVPRCELVYL